MARLQNVRAGVDRSVSDRADFGFGLAWGVEAAGGKRCVLSRKPGARRKLPPTSVEAGVDALRLHLGRDDLEPLRTQEVQEIVELLDASRELLAVEMQHENLVRNAATDLLNPNLEELIGLPKRSSDTCSTGIE